MRDTIQSKEFLEGVQKKAAFQKQFERPHCIILDSEYCSMGRMIALNACEENGYAYYDAEKLMGLLKPEERERVLNYDKLLEDINLKEQTLKEDPEFRYVSGLYQSAIRIALENGLCLIHECGIKELIEADGYTCFSVLFYAVNQQEKRERAKTTAIYGNLETNEELDKAIEKEDHGRRIYHNALSEKLWGKKESYDLCLNTDALGRKKAAELLGELMVGTKE